VFVFEGPEVDTIVSGLIDDPFHPRMTDAFAAWREVVDEDHVRIARPAYAWRAPAGGAS
jgi:hypothetical protein